LLSEAEAMTLEPSTKLTEPVGVPLVPDTTVALSSIGRPA